MTNSVLVALEKHEWYITGELVLVGLFCEEVPVQERSKMAKKLLEIKIFQRDQYIDMDQVMGNLAFQVR